MTADPRTLRRTTVMNKINSLILLYKDFNKMAADQPINVWRGAVRLEDGSTAPVLLNVERTGGLPVIVGVGEEDGLGAQSGDNGLDGSLLLGNTGNGGTVGLTSVGPASLQVDNVLAAELLEDLELGQGELTSLLGGDLGVEEGVDVGTDNVDGGAQGGGTIRLPDVDGLSGGDLARVASGLEGGLAGRDEASELGGGAVAGGDGLVTDDDQLDHVPLGPLGNSINLVLSTGDARALNEDTDDHVHAELLASRADVLETVAVSGVDTDQVEALVLDDLQVGENLGLGHAGTGGGVGREGHTVLAGTGDTRAAAGAGGSSSRASAGGGTGNGSRGSSGGSSGNGVAGQAAGGVGADVGVVSAGDGHNGLGLSVGTGSDGLGGGVDEHGAGGHGGNGTGDNGVGTSGGASVGGVLNDAGHGGAGGLDSGVGAGDDSLGLDDGGNTTNGVSSAGNLGGGSTADSGGLGDGDGGGRNGVGTGGREAGHSGSRQNHLGGGGDRGHRGSNSDGHGAGAGGVDGAGQSGGGLDGDQSRGAVVGDDLGGAATGLISTGDQRRGGSDRGDNRAGGDDRAGGIATVVDSLMAAVEVGISHGRAHQGRSREDGTLHDD